MILRVVQSLILIAAIFTYFSCSPESSSIVARFGNQTINLTEFKKAYIKNGGDLGQVNEDSLSRLSAFLNNYVNFRMQLKDAYSRGFDKDSVLQQEIQNYKNEAGKTYIIDKKIIDPGIRQLYNRRKWEFRVSYFLIKIDSLGLEKTKKVAEKILDSLQHGANWDEMVAKYSNDKSNKFDGGDIFYMTAGDVPPNFEDAVYATQPGHIYPKIVQTKYGLHIIKVTDKRLRVSEIRVSHIYVSFRDSSGQIDSLSAKTKINSAMQELNEGINFAKVAQEFSEDKNSKDHGGDIGYFSIRSMIKPFSEAAFNLKNVGDISGIVKTEYGYHIIQLTGKRGYAPFDIQKDALKNLYQQTHYDYDYQLFIDSLRNAFDYNLNDAVVQKITNIGNTTKIGADSTLFFPIDSLKLFTYSNKLCTVKQFIEKMDINSKYKNQTYTEKVVKGAINNISGELMLDQAISSLNVTDSGFAAIMKNYKEGVYIYKLQQEEVWYKIQPDPEGIYKYYLSNKNKFIWPERVKFEALFSPSDSIINSYYSLLQHGKQFDSIASNNPTQKDNPFSITIPQLVEAGSTSISKKAYALDIEGNYSKPFEVNRGYMIVKLLKKLPPKEKTYEEAKMEVSNAFSNEQIKKLEEKYIEQLKKKYKPKYYLSNLNSLINNKSGE